MYAIFLLFVAIRPIISARILAIVPTPFYSHQIVFQPIWRELSLRGHEVTVITTNPIKNTSLTNLTEIDLSFSHKLVHEDHKLQEYFSNQTNLVTLMKHGFFVINNLTTEQLQHVEVQQLIKSDKKFDLLIIESYVPAWFGFAKKYNCPIIAVSAMTINNHFRRVMGNINNPVFTHAVNLPFDIELSLFQRAICVLYEMFDEFYISYLLYPTHQRMIRDTLEDPEIDLFQIVRNVSLLFTVEIPGFNKATTNVPSVIHLNGLQITPPQALPEDIKSFLDGASQGAIYFTLGSIVKSSLLSEEKRLILMQVFRELPFRVLWKFEKNVTSLPPNVKIVSWAPQQDILRHKNTKLLMTHGGLLSVDEAIKFKVPILGFPFFGDHFYNLIRVKRLGLGSWLDFNSLTKENLKEMILETLNNNTYLENLEEISDLSAQPLSSLDKALYWIEYVIRHEGAYHLHSPLADMPFYQYYLFDVICLILFLVVVGTMILRRLLRLVKAGWNLWRKSSSKVKVQ